MNKEKQIKEMQEIVDTAYNFNHILSFEGSPNPYGEAEALYRAGYRKQSDTIIEFAEKLQQVIDKAELVVQKMHSKYHLTFGAEQKAYSNAYNATVAIRECIENLKKEYGVEE